MNRRQRRIEAKRGSPVRPVALPLVQSLLAAAAQKAEAGHLAEAERLLHQLLSLVPRHAEALHLLGVIAYQTERRDLALDVIDKALAANPNDPSIHSSRGNLLRQQGQLEEAAGSYRKSIALTPNFAEAARAGPPG
jgi:protein O-GlcNAc transferase